MKYAQWLKRDPVRNCFLLPNEIFLLGLSPGALAVYSYLICCENRNSTAVQSSADEHQHRPQVCV